MGRTFFLLVALLGTGCATLSGSTHVEVPSAAVRTDDVASIDAAIKTMYDVLCGPAGQPRQWSRDRSLYVPDVRFFIMSEDAEHRPVERTVSHQEFVDIYDQELTSKGFYEKEINRVTLEFGNMAHVYSTYESRHTPDGPVIERGINSVALFYDGHRWWISAISWDEERPDNPLPAEYLPK